MDLHPDRHHGLTPEQLRRLVRRQERRTPWGFYVLATACALMLCLSLGWILFRGERRPPGALPLAPLAQAPTSPAQAAPPAPTGIPVQRVEAHQRVIASGEAEPSAVARATTTRVLVRSVPPGAMVFLGETRLGVTNLAWSCDPARGPYQLRVELPGYAPGAVEVDPRATDDVEVRLQRLAVQQEATAPAARPERAWQPAPATGPRPGPAPAPPKASAPAAPPPPPEDLLYEPL
jgi:hypothetical protein